jgi:hypothetical protein
MNEAAARTPTTDHPHDGGVLSRRDQEGGGGRALTAIAYVLDRSQSDEAGLGPHLCPVTEAWARLVAAEAELLGFDADAHRRVRRLAWYGAKEPELSVALAWRSYLADRRTNVLALVTSSMVDDSPDTIQVAVLKIAGEWVVAQHLDGACVLMHGPSGRAATTGAPSELIGHLDALEAGGLLTDRDLAAVGKVLEERGAALRRTEASS